MTEMFKTVEKTSAYEAVQYEVTTLNQYGPATVIVYRPTEDSREASIAVDATASITPGEARCLALALLQAAHRAEQETIAALNWQDLSHDQMLRAEEYITARKKINAIKIVRGSLSIGLKQAKNIVEQRMAAIEAVIEAEKLQAAKDAEASYIPGFIGAEVRDHLIGDYDWHTMSDEDRTEVDEFLLVDKVYLAVDVMVEVTGMPVDDALTFARRRHKDFMNMEDFEAGRAASETAQAIWNNMVERGLTGDEFIDELGWWAELDASDRDAIDALIIEGKIIHAVKMIREELGLDLPPAKDLMNERRAYLGGQAAE